jgi:hypothetical protein
MSEDIFLKGEDRTGSYVAFSLANCCMPTLLKSKPSNLVCFRKCYIDSRVNFFKALIKECEGFGCNARVLCECEKSIYIIIYDKQMLLEVIQSNIENPLLASNGYESGCPYLHKALTRLGERYGSYRKCRELGQNEDFPHEIGIMLGYPVTDVEEYIKNNGENYVMCGYWKVYNNAEEAIRVFELFTKIRKEAMELFYAGRPLKEMIS